MNYKKPENLYTTQQERFSNNEKDQYYIRRRNIIIEHVGNETVFPSISRAKKYSRDLIRQGKTVFVDRSTDKKKGKAPAKDIV